MAAPRSAASRLFQNRAFLWLCLIATNLAVLALAILLISIVWQGWSTLDADFVTQRAVQTHLFTIEQVGDRNDFDWLEV